jgi:hypothetical protein
MRRRDIKALTSHHSKKPLSMKGCGLERSRAIGKKKLHPSQKPGFSGRNFSLFLYKSSFQVGKNH